MKKRRHNYTAEEKVFILKRHLIDKIPVSDICEQYNMQPTAFYRWQKEFSAAINLIRDNLMIGNEASP